MAPSPGLRLLQFAPLLAATDATSGTDLRNYHLARQASCFMSVTHLAFSRTSNVPASSGSIEVLTVPQENRYRPSDLLLGLLGSVPFSVLNYTRKEMRAELSALLQRRAFDAVLIEGVQLARYMPLLRGAPGRPPVLCDWHNIESEVLERFADVERHPLRKLYARISAAKLREFERSFLDDCDMHIVVSERERMALHAWGTARPIHVIENGVDVKHFSEREIDEAYASFRFRARAAKPRCRLLFVGSMDYHANAQAVESFVRECWPSIHTELPDAVFTIVGRDPTPAVCRLAALPGVEVTGTVPDVRPYYREAFASIVPLRTGGGTRLKILEAMAAGTPVISTALGAEGLAAQPGTDFLLADHPAQMRQAAVALERDPVIRARFVEAGRRLVTGRYDWAVLGARLVNLLASLVQCTRRAAALSGQ